MRLNSPRPARALAIAAAALLLTTGAGLAQTKIGGDLSRFMTPAEEFPDAYEVAMEFPRSNDQFREDWGDEIFAICEQTGRSGGYMRIYDLRSPEAILSPDRFVVLIERFSSIEGAEQWYDYAFPAPFRTYIASAEPLELADNPSRDLSHADEGRLAVIENGPDAPYALEKYLEYRYRNVQVLIWAQGHEEFDVKYMRWLGTKVLRAMEASLP